MAQGLVAKNSVTGTGVAGAPIGAPGGCPFATYAVQAKGTGGVPTFTATLQGSLDNVNWTDIVTLGADGVLVWETTGKPSLFVRVNVTALTLNAASALVITAVAVP